MATQIGDNVSLGLALLNLSDALSATDPAAAAEAARTAAGQLRRTGRRYYLTGAVMNLFQALLMLGDWDGAEAELARAADSDGLADLDYLVCAQGLLAALRGDAEGAGTMLAALGDLRATEDPQDAAMISITEAFAAAARRQLPDALRHARRALSYADALGIKSDSPRWAWPLAVRAAHELGDTDAVRELLAVLDSYQPGHLAPMLRAERDLARARLAARDGDGDGDGYGDGDGDQVVAASFAAAIVSLREHSTPYHLAHGLLDRARYLLARFDAEAAALALEEARAIGHRLRCSALLDRAEDLARSQL
jgi:tetratricopeptide (TPR) repeat protein